tara:strand:+ start:124 stop:993 length:870 start_codon:yes stop_codon:yes gene_type:complete
MSISKDDYILRAFSKIQHKKWELYVITRVIHLLDDPELEFVCQQLIKTPDHKRYLADLCFPELELYCEVDELQHSSEEHAIADENRMKEIIDASHFTEKRIQIYDNNLKIKELTVINEEIDSLIRYIKDRKQEYIADNKFNPWDYYKKYNPEVHIERGYIDTKDNVSFLNHRDALRCFGYDGGHFQRAVWSIKGSDKGVWFPKLYENDLWNNTLSDDFSRIEMTKKDHSIIDVEFEDVEWYTFAHYKDFLGQTVYKFLGEFHSSRELSTESCRVYTREGTYVDLTKFLN